MYQSFAYLGQFPSFDVVLAAANDDDYSDYSYSSPSQEEVGVVGEVIGPSMTMISPWDG